MTLTLDEERMDDGSEDGLKGGCSVCWCLKGCIDQTEGGTVQLYAVSCAMVLLKYLDMSLLYYGSWLIAPVGCNSLFLLTLPV